jgi:aminopeptidase N
MIRFELQDDDMFFNVLQSYAAEYGNSTATGDAFRDWLGYISGKDFTDFFDQWYYGEGYPVFDITWHQDAENLVITSTQSTSTNITTLFKMLVPYRLNFSDGTDTTLILYQGSNVSSYNIPLTKSVDYIELDPEQWILHRLNSLSVGLEEEDNPVYFTIGPNPATDHFTVYFSHPAHKQFSLSIADLTGRTVFEYAIAPSSQSIDISGIPAGAYVVIVSDGRYLLNKKLIINK